jgi:CheY-like chemotaxis protein
MRLMAATDGDAHVERPIHRSAQPVGDQGSLGKVLVVEDNSLNQLVAEGLLSRLGYEALSVVNGVEALDAVASFHYSAILMDCHMPVMDGFTATEEIRRRQSNGSRIPIIAMTAGALAEDRERCLAVGMDDYISKPVDLKALEAVLSRWIRVGPPTRNGAGAGASGHPSPKGVDERPPIDESRLESLRDLEAPDGSSILASIVAAFTGHSAGLVLRLREAADAGDNDRLQAVAHELKGAAATAGATHVAELCGKIELAARRGGPRPSGELLDRLGIEFERAKSALATSVFSASASGQ